jgi:hypothetical protein
MNWNTTENCSQIIYHPSFMGALLGVGSLFVVLSAREWRTPVLSVVGILNL